MGKASSPLRLEAALVEQAALAGKQLHRSTAEQIEHWAEIGRQIASSLSPETLLQLSTGLARIKVEPIITPSIDPDALFVELERQRNDGELQADISHSRMQYQTSVQYPGLLEQIAPDGTIQLGRFENGEFHPSSVHQAAHK